MLRRPRVPFKVFARGSSLRRRVAYSLAIVRLILVPVILLSIYYLIAMARIVDRIVSVDAPVATMAQQVSIQMLDARRAEWVLIVVSALTLIFSVWVSFTLPRAVVKPLVDLKAAVDHAAAGNYEIEFDVEGEAEVSQLAESVRNLISHVRQKRNHFVGKS